MEILGREELRFEASPRALEGCCDCWRGAVPKICCIKEKPAKAVPKATRLQQCLSRIPAEQECVNIEIKSNASTDHATTNYPDIWTEIPPNGRVCARTGLKHAKLYTLLGKGGLGRPYVRVANLRGPGAKQGKTIFHVGDMLRFLDWMAKQQGSGEKNTLTTIKPSNSADSEMENNGQ